MRRAVVILFLLLPWAAKAEHLFEAGVRAGLAGFDTRCEYVEPFAQMHAGLVLSYAYHSPYILGLRCALNFDRHQAGFTKAGYNDTYTVIDVENDPMQVDYSIGLLNERYTTYSVGIPLQLALSYKGLNLYIGPKLVLPISCSWTETAENCELSVYYALQDNRVYDSYPLAASRSFREGQNGTRNLPKTRFFLATEVCYDILLSSGRFRKSYLSVGFYADYSLSRMEGDPSERISLLMLSDTREGFPLHRILTPVVAANRQGKRLVNSLQPFALGLKISYRFGYTPQRTASPRTCRCLLY